MSESRNVIGERSAQERIESMGGSWMSWFEDLAACEITSLSTHDFDEHCGTKDTAFSVKAGCGNLEHISQGQQRQKLSGQQE